MLQADDLGEGLDYILIQEEGDTLFPGKFGR